MADVPSSSARIQIEATRFGSSVSESLVQSMGGAINFLLNAVLPVGSIIDTMLSEAQFQASAGTGWVLSDGRSVVGSQYQITTGATTIPDLRGVFRRGRNYARSTSTGDTGGSKAVGTYTADQFKSHTHTYGGLYTDSFRDVDGGSERYRTIPLSGEHTSATGGAETSPRCVTVNVMIRIN